ncbi:hypothetical protein SAMN04487910_4343 [Aquimarina amphilecti]|uniref:Uncharacterized protein n=1 Tax=Aquimarina amphilecti TaxID=1038014 RepID=A0A1H7W990_AQUAM|nr:hypothetical protein [Aquimarina amphilecti]SEM18051.1 hypothetical protein SAMN04487910_4343 [Aquimarina amphilecti]
MLKNISIFLLLIVSQISFAQNEELFNRLRAINNGTTTFYNVDGVDFSKQTISSEFNEKYLKKAYRKYKIKKKDHKETDKELSFENYKVIKREELGNGLVSISVHYFVKNKDNRISIFWFGYYDKSNPVFERKMIDLILNDAIPKSSFCSKKTDIVNFAGREIKLGGNCNWMNINNVQCPYYGQMSWSVHKTKESADASIQNQLKATKSQNGGKVISEEEIAIVFEGVSTKAKKVYYDFTGVTSLLASMSGGKNLTIYYVSEKVRDNYVSCILSFWNNDNINPSGLPPLLEEVMKISEK